MLLRTLMSGDETLVGDLSTILSFHMEKSSLTTAGIQKTLVTGVHKFCFKVVKHFVGKWNLLTLHLSKKNIADPRIRDR